MQSRRKKRICGKLWPATSMIGGMSRTASESIRFASHLHRLSNSQRSLWHSSDRQPWLWLHLSLPRSFSAINFWLKALKSSDRERTFSPASQPHWKVALWQVGDKRAESYVLHTVSQAERSTNSFQVFCSKAGMFLSTDVKPYVRFVCFFALCTKMMLVCWLANEDDVLDCRLQDR